MATIKEQRDEWMAERGVREQTPEEQLFLIRALLGLNPDQETVTGVRLLMQLGREGFADARGPRYDVLNNTFADWVPTPNWPAPQYPLV
jgi:hypothetical protein